MAQVQYNFKIEDNLKSKAEELSKEFENKQEFLEALLNSYETSKANAGADDIDISKFEDIDIKTKALLNDAFKHILYTLQQNTTSVKQELLSTEQEKKAIAEERAAFQTQIQELQAKHNQDLFTKEQEHKEQQIKKDETITTLEIEIKDISEEKIAFQTQLQAKEKELMQVQSIADQSQAITKENQELRKELKQLETSYKEQIKAKEQELKKLNTQLQAKEKEIYRKDIDIENMQKDIQKLQNDISKYQEDMKEKNKEIKEIEKQNTILSTKLEMQKEPV